MRLKGDNYVARYLFVNKDVSSVFVSFFSVVLEYIS